MQGGNGSKGCRDPTGWERSYPVKSTDHGPWGIWWPYNMVLPLLRPTAWGKTRGKSSISLSIAIVEIAFLSSGAVKVRYCKGWIVQAMMQWPDKSLWIVKSTHLQKLLLMAWSSQKSHSCNTFCISWSSNSYHNYKYRILMSALIRDLACPNLQYIADWM